MTAPPLVSIRTFMNTMEAEIAQSALESAGIQSLVRADDCGGLRPHMQMAGVQLLVREDEAEDADRLLRAELA